MSKQLKFKFKKTLKKAEFVHADLEYHQELISEAKQLFNDEISALIAKLPAEDQAKLKAEIERQHLKNLQAHQEAAERADRAGQIEEEVAQFINGDCTALAIIEDPHDDPADTPKPEKVKSIELKKLFRKIAEQTHPDKVRANGFSEKEISRLERVFKKALQAYTDNNWYLLYSIAHELDLSIDNATQTHIDWVEEDIRNTLGAIAQIANLVAWGWYIGNEKAKLQAVRYYFETFYNFHHPDLQS
jgi:DnaJ-domain-containing protein 1